VREGFDYKQVYCPEAGKSKLLFNAAKDANAFIKFKSRIDNEASKSKVYRCEACGGYHLTTKEREGAKKTHKQKPKKNRGRASIRNAY
jgi:hypothetical protein